MSVRGCRQMRGLLNAENAEAVQQVTQAKRLRGPYLVKEGNHWHSLRRPNFHYQFVHNLG